MPLMICIPARMNEKDMQVDATAFTMRLSDIVAYTLEI
jgi:hypothetical protein